MSEAAQAVEDTAPETTEEVNEQPTEQPEPREPEHMFEDVETTEEPQIEETDEVVDTPEKPESEATEDDPDRPDWLPEKFKTPEDLVKAYNEMGKKIREKNEPPEEYDIKMPDNIEGELTEDDISVFKDVGLNNEQAQKLTDYLYETVVPALSEAKVNLEKDRLALEWNTNADSQEFAQQLAQVKAYAQQNLPDNVVNELAKTASGIQTLSRMMESGESAARVNGTNSTPRPDKATLQDLMNDERYWNGDEEYKAYVQQQFKLAYD